MQSTTMTTQRWHKAYDIWPISISEMRALSEAGDATTTMVAVAAAAAASTVWKKTKI